MNKTLLITLSLGLLGMAGANNTGAPGPSPIVNGMVRAGEVILNSGSFTGTQGEGAETFQSDSNTVKATVAQVGGVQVMLGGVDLSPQNNPQQTIVVRPGESGDLVYTVQNTGNGDDNVTLVYSSTSPDLPEAWIDLNGDSVRSAGEDLTNGSVVPMLAGETFTVHVLTPVATSAPGSDLYLTNLQANANYGAVPDDENYGAVDVLDQLAVTLQNDIGTTFTPGSVTTVNKTLTNTGNVPVTGLDATTTESDNKNLLTFTYRVGTSAPHATLQAALDESFSTDGALNQNQTRPVVITATAVKTGVAHLDTVMLKHTLTVRPDADDEAGLPEDDESFFEARVFAGTNNKAQSVCSFSGSAYSCGPMDKTDKVAKPCDVIIYGITARSVNVGGILRAPVIRDTVPSTLVPLFASAYMDTSSSFPTTASGTVVSLDKTNWVSQLSGTDFTTPVGPMGTTIYAGYDANGDYAINDTDAMTDQNVLSLVIGAQVVGNNCAAFDQSSASNFPSLPYDDQSGSTPLPGF